MNTIKLVSLFLIMATFIFCSDNKVVIIGEESEDSTEVDVPFNVPATEDYIFYEANLRCFATSNSFNALRKRLTEIAQMKVNVLWLMPIHDVGIVKGINSPYSVRDYKSIKAEYGTLSDFRDLIREAHRLNIAVVMDWVANHTSFDNAWTTNKTWYTLDNDGNITYPAGTNWTNSADLNYDNQEMRKAMIDAMRYWIVNANIDGFRCDAADKVPADFWADAISQLNTVAKRKLIWLAEGEALSTMNAGFQMNYGWPFYRKLKSVFNTGEAANNLFLVYTSETANMPSEKRMLRFTTNHDETAWDKPPVTLFKSQKGSMSAFIISTYIGGVPLVYSSQEIGTDVNVPFFSSLIMDWSNNAALKDEYKKILTYYAQTDALRKGNLTTYNHNDIVCFSRQLGSKTVLVIANTRANSINWTVPTALLQNNQWKNAFTNNTQPLSTNITVGEYEYIVLYK
jgi:alpha-amylase